MGLLKNLFRKPLEKAVYYACRQLRGMEAGTMLADFAVGSFGDEIEKVASVLDEKATKQLGADLTAVVITAVNLYEMTHPKK